MRKANFAFGLAFAFLPTIGSEAASNLKHPVAISFALEASGENVDCTHDLIEVGSRKIGAKLHDARLYISAPALIDQTGKEIPIDLERNDWQYANVALLNFADKSGSCQGMSAVNDTIRGMAPPGRYRGLSFTVGVPSFTKGEDGRDVLLNHSNFATAPAPLDIQSMAWNWQAGRKFIKIEIDPLGGVTRAPLPPKQPRLASNDQPLAGGPESVKASEIAKLNSAQTMEPPRSDLTKVNSDGTITVATWALHLGSTGCKGDPLTGEIASCASPNRIPVKFSSFDPDKQRVVLDLGSLLSGVDLNHDAGGATGCMSGPADPECGPIFEKLGLNLKETEVDANDGGKPSASGSHLFRVEFKK